MEQHRGLVEQTIVVILAAGKGTRMGQSELAKVCHEIGGVPAINRTIRLFKRMGFGKFLLVVGAKAEQVLETVGREHPAMLYVYQQARLGTGHAAKIAAEALRSLGHTGHVLVTLGDKFLEQPAVDTLLAGYVEQRADAALLTVPKGKTTAGGRVFVDEDGQTLDIIEAPDLARQAIVDELKDRMTQDREITGTSILELANKHLPNPKKRAAAVGELIALAKDGTLVDRRTLETIVQSEQYNLRIDGKQYSARQIEQICKTLNPSLYLFRAEAFYQGVLLLDNDNAQGDYYLTDIVKSLVGIRDAQGRCRYRVRAVLADEADWIQGFNSPDELRMLEDYLGRKETRSG